MEKKYYLFDGEKYIGPFDLEELRSKGLSPETPVWESHLSFLGGLQLLGDLPSGQAPKKQGVRNFFERNKIFFEIFLTSSIALMAIYVSSVANGITKGQLEIQKLEKAPRIELLHSIKANENGQEYYHLIEINNLGGAIDSITIDNCTYLSIDHFSDDEKTEIPVIGREEKPQRTGLGKDSIAKMIIYNAYEYKNKVDDYMNKIEPRFPLSSEITTYIKISYQDIFYNTNTEYFKFESREIEKVEAAIGQEKFRKFKSEPYPLTQINRESLEMLLKKY